MGVIREIETIDLHEITAALNQAGYCAEPDPDTAFGIVAWESEQSRDAIGDWLTLSEFGQLNVSSVSVWRWKAIAIIRRHIKEAK